MYHNLKILTSYFQKYLKRVKLPDPILGRGYGAQASPDNPTSKSLTIKTLASPLNIATNMEHKY